MTDSANTAPKPSSSVKLVLLGEAAVGKSSLVLRFVNNDFQENKEPTIGAAFLTQKISLPSRTIKFEIWDTAGQERFASLAPMYYRNAQAALVVYDLTKPTSLTKAKHWVAELQRQASPGIVIALVGNKLDLTSSDSSSDEPATASAEEETDAPPATEGAEDSSDARKVSTAEAKAYADEESLLFFETSAKTGSNVANVFTAIANAIPETNLKSSGGRGAGGATQAALSGAANRGADASVNLADRGKAAKDNSLITDRARIEALEAKVEQLLAVHNISGERSNESKESSHQSTGTLDDIDDLPKQSNTTVQIPVSYSKPSENHLQRHDNNSHVSLVDLSNDIVSSDLVSVELAEWLVDLYRREMAVYVPFVTIPTDQSLDYLRRHRPFVLLTILFAASYKDPRLQERLNNAVKQVVSQRMIMNSQVSFDLLQGLLIYLASYDLYPSSTSNAEPSFSLPKSNLFRISALLQKLPTFPYSSYLEKVCESLKDKDEYDSDKYLLYIVQLQRIMEKIDRLLAVHSSDSVEAVKLHFLSLCSDLDAFRERLPFSLSDNSLLLIQFYTTQLYLVQISLVSSFGESVPAPKSPSWTGWRIDALRAGLIASNAVLRHFLSLPDDVVTVINNTQLVQIGFATLVGAKMTAAAHNEAASQEMKGILENFNLMQILEEIIRRFDYLRESNIISNMEESALWSNRKRMAALRKWLGSKVSQKPSHGTELQQNTDAIAEVGPTQTETVNLSDVDRLLFEDWASIPGFSADPMLGVNFDLPWTQHFENFDYR
ncbi:MAG: hypothetical protein Q9227_001227 [Pyrenula ochraceoflavens]